MLKSFLFDKSKYLAADENGQEVLLVVDYKKNTYKLVGKGSQEFRTELGIIAADLLKRKHKVNFADHVRVY